MWLIGKEGRNQEGCTVLIAWKCLLKYGRKGTTIYIVWMKSKIENCQVCHKVRTAGFNLCRLLSTCPPYHICMYHHPAVINDGVQRRLCHKLCLLYFRVGIRLIDGKAFIVKIGMTQL